MRLRYVVFLWLWGRGVVGMVVVVLVVVMVVVVKPNADGCGDDKVKADRGDMNASKENIEKMQQQTAEKAKKDHEGK